MDWFHTVIAYTIEFAEVAVFGFLFAGFLQATVRPSAVARYLSGYSLWRANLIGATIGFFTPLCCCTAIPTALTLWRGGSRAGPACAFLIATPWFNWYGLVALWIFLGWQVAFAVASSAILIAFLTGMLIDLVTAKTLSSSARREALNKTTSATDPPSLDQSALTCCIADTPCGGNENKENGFFDFSRPRDKFVSASATTPCP